MYRLEDEKEDWAGMLGFFYTVKLNSERLPQSISHSVVKLTMHAHIRTDQRIIALISEVDQCWPIVTSLQICSRFCNTKGLTSSVKDFADEIRAVV